MGMYGSYIGMMEKNMESNVWHGYLGTNLAFVQTVRGF